MIQSGAVQDSSAPYRESRPAFTRGKLYRLLSNVVYIGKARHKDRTYDGEHDAIIDDETFATVQTLLKTQLRFARMAPTSGTSICSPACCSTRPAIV